jgi:precorrin-6B methylase 2
MTMRRQRIQKKQKQEPTPERIMQFAFGYAPPLIIEAAVRNRVFDVLDEKPRTLEEVSAATGASVRGLRVVLNALVGLELLAKNGKERYALTPESATFLVSSSPSFYGGLFRHTSEHLLPAWMEINQVVRTGRPATSVNQEQKGAEFFQQFVEGIFPISYPAAQVLAQVLGIPQSRQPVSVLDVGAGSGVWGIALAQASPHVRVTAVDWPGVLPVTRRMASRFGLTDRFRFLEGDVQEAGVGSGYDVGILGHVLHSEGEERGRALLGKLFQALAPGGSVVIAEFLVNEERTGPPQALIFAVNLLVHTDRGDTFSFGEISEWLRAAGFENPRTVEAPGPSPLIIATKPRRKEAV